MGGYSEGLEGRPPPVVEAAERAVLAAGAGIRARVGAEVVATKQTARDLVTAVDGEVQEAIRAALLGQYPSHAFLGEEGFEAGALEAALGSGAEHCWILDPLDGTTNFVHGLELSAVSLGLAFRGEMAAGIVFDPFRDELFTAWKGGGAYVTRGGDAGARRRLSVDSAASAAEAVVYTGYAATDEAVGPFLRGIGGLSRNVRAVRMLGSAAIMFAWVAAGRGSAYVEVDLSPWDICAGALLVREAGGTVTGLDGSPYELIRTRAVAASNGKVHGAVLDLMTGADAVGLDRAAEGEDWTAGLRNFE